MRRSTYGIGLILIGFFFVKLLRFKTLGYIFNDMYAFLQMSHSWMDGRPFMYENIWGYHHRIHNYYSVLLWGPLCRAFGAYGLFAVQATLLAVGYAAVNEHLNRRAAPAWVPYVLIGVMLCGPVSFWLNDHPNIGWHTELTYLPFALLFALALMGRSRLVAVMAGLAVVLVKEDGAVLAALIHLIYEGLQFINRQPARPLWKWLSEGRFWLILAGWVAVFLSGMAWIGYKNGFAEPRLQMALTLLNDNVGKVAFWRQMLGQTGRSMVLLLPVLGVLALFMRQLRSRSIGGVLLLWGAGVLTLTLLNVVQSVHYYGQKLFYLVALTWPPRFILPWAFSAALLTLLAGLSTDKFRPLPSARVWLIGVGLFMIQIPIIYIARPEIPSLHDWADTLRGRYARDREVIYLQSDDLAVARCVADQLPADANVFIFDYLVPFFHRQYGIWPTGKQYQPADIALIPLVDKQGLRQALPMRKPYRVIRLNAYDLYVSAAYEQRVAQCVANVGKR